MTNADTPTNSGDTEQAKAGKRARQQVQDAFELSQYVVETGVTDKDGKPLAFSDIGTIQSTAAAIEIIGVNGGSAAAPKTLTKDEWLAFEQAYYRLAIATSPVTAETLRNTRYAAGAGASFADAPLNVAKWWTSASAAQRFTWWLWTITFAFALFVLGTEWGIDKLGMSTNADKVKVWKDVLEAVQPWAYGGLGACAYLLRSGHYFIYARSFDLRRKPEYFNRILLGALSGGAIILFSDYLMSQEDSVSHIGTTALGFIAGYSSDFLFNTIERIITAIFPKVDVETVPQDGAAKQPVPPLPDGGRQDASGGNGKADGK